MQYLGTHETLIQQSYDWSERSPSVAVLEAIAAIENVHPTDLHTDPGIRLHDDVDLEALDALVTHDGDISVSFTVADYTVHIEGSLLTVSARAAAPD